MAINTEKLLNRPSELHRRYSGRVAMQKSLQEKMISAGPSNIVLTKKSVKNIGIIKVNVIKIENILKGTLASEKKALDEKKRKDSSQRREKQEEKLETKPNVERGEIKMPKAPRMGILDWIKNFIGNVLLGYFAVRLIDHLPKIIPIVKFLGKAADFIIDIGGKLLNGLATFIDWGYKAYDATRGFIKGLGGENFAQGFDKFVSAIDTTLFLTTFLAGDLLSEYLFGGDGAPGPGTRMGGKPQVTTSGGGTAGKPDIRNPLRQRPTVTTGQGGKPSGSRLPGTAPKVTGSGGGPKIKVPRGIKARGGLLGLVMMIPDLIDAGMLVSQGRGKDGLRALLSAVSGVVAGMTAYSATLAGAAALGITGVGLPAAIGLALAGFGASALAGSAAYNLADAGLKKMGLFDNDPKTGNPYTYRSGGITRGGKRQTGARRSIGGTRKGKYKRVILRKPSEVEIKPGADVGGEEKILGIFPKPKVPDFINPFKVVKTAGENLGKTDYFGPILAITSKITLGQKPTQKDYENVGLGINMLISKGIQDKQLKGGIVAAFAEGGFVDPDILSAAETGGDISNWVAKTFQGEIESNAQKTLREIKENIQKKKLGATDPSKAPSPGDMGIGDGGGVQVSSDSEDFWLLATAAMFENSDPQGAADVAQVIYNRTQYPAWKSPTIRKAILNPNQFQPVRQYGGTSAWASIKTKEDAIRFSKSHGKTVEQLERVAAALLDKSKQSDARSFVGPRDSFRAEAYEKANNHLANETEKTRHGHTFGFEPGGAMIGQFKAGKLAAAQVNAGIVGDVSLKGGDGRFIQGNSGRSEGTHFHIGTNKPGDGSGVAAAGFNVIKHFLGNKSVYVGRSGETIPANAKDDQIRGYIARGQAAHRQTELDLQIGGTGAGNKVAFPLALKGMKYSSSDGYGVSADIVGTNAFVGHGRYKPDGTLAPQQRLVLNSGAPDFYAFHGENFGIVPKDGFILKLHKGEMFKVIDKDSVDLLGFDLSKEIIDIENKAQLVAKAPSIIERLKSISGYASYEEGSQETIIISTPNPTVDDYESPTYSGGGMMMAFGGGEDPFESLYQGG